MSLLGQITIHHFVSYEIVDNPMKRPKAKGTQPDYSCESTFSYYHIGNASIHSITHGLSVS